MSDKAVQADPDSGINGGPKSCPSWLYGELVGQVKSTLGTQKEK